MSRVQDNGVGQYLIDKPLVHRGIISIISGIVVILGYMIIWAINDASWKRSIDIELKTLQSDAKEIKAQIQILPRADELRVKSLENWQKQHERQHERDDEN